MWMDVSHEESFLCSRPNIELLKLFPLSKVFSVDPLSIGGSLKSVAPSIHRKLKQLETF